MYAVTLLPAPRARIECLRTRRVETRWDLVVVALLLVLALLR